ncbi:MAG: hypothetical protein AAFZ15_03130 [Bacteroidota bacterium]
MKKSIFLPVLFFSFFLMFANNTVISQNYAEIAHIYPTEYADLDGVNLTEYHLEKVKKVHYEYQQGLHDVRAAFLFPDDERAEKRKLKKKYYDKLVQVLTPEQMRAVEAEADGRKAMKIQNSAVRYMEEFDYLDLTFEQATSVALNLDSLKTIGEPFLGKAEVFLKKILTEEQLEKYETHQETPPEEKAVPKEYKESMKQIRDEERREIEEMKPQFLSLIHLMKSYYIPERALIRGKLEKELSTQEKITVDELRDLYADFLEENIDEEQEWQNLQRDFGFFAVDLLEIMHEFNSLMTKEIFNGKGTRYVRMALNTNREAFYQARELAEKLDPQIDLLQKEMDLLEASLLEQSFVGVAPKYKNEVDRDVEKIKRKAAQKNYLTPKIEYRRNIAFLLVNGIVGINDEINSDRGVHSLHVYPVPAIDQQTVYFEIKTSGSTAVQIISQDGKVLQNIFSGNLDAGEYNMNAQINNIQSDLFFYRVSGKDGVSIAKSIKGD